MIVKFLSNEKTRLPSLDVLILAGMLLATGGSVVGAVIFDSEQFHVSTAKNIKAGSEEPSLSFARIAAICSGGLSVIQRAEDRRAAIEIAQGLPGYAIDVNAYTAVYLQPASDEELLILYGRALEKTFSSKAQDETLRRTLECELMKRELL